jgi:hypothetical protein
LAFPIVKPLSSQTTNIYYKPANNDQCTALWLSLHQGHLYTLKWLISKQAHVNAVRLSYGITTTRSVPLSVVQELVEHAADVNNINRKQFTRLSHAV